MSEQEVNGNQDTTEEEQNEAIDGVIDAGAGAGTVGDDGDGGDDSAGTSVAAQPKGVSADDKRRYLVEIVANDGLSKAAEDIAQQIGAKSGILIVDDLAFAAADLFTIDIKNKLQAFESLINEQLLACRELCRELEGEVQEEAPSTEKLENFKEFLENLPQDKGVGDMLFMAPGGFAAGALGAIGGVGTVAAAVSESLQAVADVISYFRADYEMKGQEIENIDVLYIKALVANHLLEKGATVHLFNFNVVDQSPILSNLISLLKEHLKLLACLEQIDPQSMEAQIEALRTYVETLRSNYGEAIVNVGEQVLRDLQQEITQSQTRIAGYQKNRFGNSYVTALESHLTSLRSKYVEAVAADTGASEAAVRSEIENTTQALENSNLSQAKKDELVAHRNNMQAELAKILILKHSQPGEKLRQSIAAVEGDLAQIREAWVPQSRIDAEEQHLAALQNKQADLIAANNNNAAQALKGELSKMEKSLEEMEKLFSKAQRHLNGAKKISDSLNTFVQNVSTVADGQTYSPLIAACLRDYIAADDLEINFLLKLKLISAGGEIISKKDWGFWRRPDFSYLGGGVISYVLADKSGQVIAADTVYGMSKLEHNIGNNPKTLNYNIE